MDVPLTCAHGVTACGRVLTPLVISLTAMPRTRSASATRARWQRQGTASAHISTTCSPAASSMQVFRLSANASVCM
jgi:hypothetical protein